MSVNLLKSLCSLRESTFSHLDSLGRTSILSLYNSLIYKLPAKRDCTTGIFSIDTPDVRVFLICLRPIRSVYVCSVGVYMNIRMFLIISTKSCNNASMLQFSLK